jgi:hypothetical protein
VEGRPLCTSKLSHRFFLAKIEVDQLRPCDKQSLRNALQSFFAWHVEDADLYSVNFLHWGAPKVWYCVSPANKAKFERLAAALHPDQLRQCKGFLRHKDILISPTILKQFGVRFHVVSRLPCLSNSAFASRLCHFVDMVFGIRTMRDL